MRRHALEQSWQAGLFLVETHYANLAVKLICICARRIHRPYRAASTEAMVGEERSFVRFVVGAGGESSPQLTLNLQRLWVRMGSKPEPVVNNCISQLNQRVHILVGCSTMLKAFSTIEREN